MPQLKQIVLFALLFNSNFLYSQFVLREHFRNSRVPSDVYLRESAVLTAGTTDTEGDGWLRLTQASVNKKGYAFIDRPFPSTLGLNVEFEFKAWRDTESTQYTGGDGFSVFLYDGSVTKENFRLGAYGGSLGYTRNSAVSPSVPNGLRGGYIGVGFDSYGGFGNNWEGKNGMLNNNNASIPSDFTGESTIPNTIVLRGATNETTSSNSNRILAYKKLGDRTESANAIRRRGELDYDVLTATRPTDELFYRKIKIEIKPVLDNGVRKYQIKIFMNKVKDALYNSTAEITYVTEQVIPETLKIGFAASTGGSYNNHEIRNLVITTTGNLSVSNLADRAQVCRETIDQVVNFKLEVNNSNSNTFRRIELESEFKNAQDQSALLSDALVINSINYTTNITDRNLSIVNNKITGTIGLPGDNIGTVTVNATIKKPNIPIQNDVTVDTDELTDDDTTNNTSTQIITRNVCKVVTNPMIRAKPKVSN